MVLNIYYKKSLVFICLIVFLFSIVSVTASDVNETIGVSEVQVDEIISQDIDENSESELSVYNDEAILAEENSNETEVLSSGSYLEGGSSGHIESKEMRIVKNSNEKFKVQLVGSYVSNRNVYFTVYDSDKSGEYVGDFESKSDMNGYATLNANLNSGHYWIQISSDDHGSVYNSLTVRPNGYSSVKVHVQNAKYKKNNYIDCTWWGIFSGYLKIYKGSKLVKKVSLKTHYSNDNEVGFIWFDGHSVNTKKLVPGKYTAKIVNNKGKVIAKKSFKIIGKIKNKTKKKKNTKKTFKAKIVTMKAKYKWVTKKKGKYVVKARLWRVFSGVMGYYNDVDIILYKNGKQLKSSKYLSKYKYKENGKWKWWSKWRHGGVDHAYHRYSTNLPVSQIKVKWVA